MKKYTEKEIEISHYAEPYCMFCGEPEKANWDEYTRYSECDCKDAMHNRKIRKQIESLKDAIVKPKYEIIKRRFLVKL